MKRENVPMMSAKNIVFRTKIPDKWFGIAYNMNIYRGCPHGCIYCDSRSSCFKNLDFDTVKVKEDALRIIRDDLARKAMTGVVGTGAMSDPYNPLEKALKLTRHSLELINAFKFGVSLVTKSAMVTRDVDILTDIKAHSPTIVKFSITTADDALCKKLEPNVSSASERFEAMRLLADAGIFCGVLITPLLPFVTDTEENILAILRQAKAAGAKFVYTYMGMTLRAGSREYYLEHLENLQPGLKEKYQKRFGTRYSCVSPRSKKLWNVYIAECERLGLLYEMRSIIRHYKAGYEKPWLKLD